MKDSRKFARIVALVIAAVMVLTTLASALATFVYGASGTSNPSSTIIASVTNIYFYDNSDKIEQGTWIDISFTIRTDESHIPSDKATIDMAKDFRIHESWWTTDGSTNMKIDPADDGFSITIEHIKYNSINEYRTLTIGEINKDNTSPSLGFFSGKIIVMTIPRSYFTKSNNSGGNTSDEGGSSGTTVDDEVTYVSNIVFESATAKDKHGRVLDSIDKDTEPFTVEIVYTDTGLRHTEIGNVRDTSVQTFLVPGGGFDFTGTTKGTVEYLTTTGSGSRSTYPRFRATFSNLTYNGGGNELGFQVYYLFHYFDDPVKGEGKASISAVEGDDDDDKDKMGMAVPKIIIDNYSYGDETIIAGDEFNLNFSIRNTSVQLPLENIVITLTPASNEAQKEGPGLIVASSSNTIYVPELGEGGSIPYTVAFQARPDAEVTSHIIQIGFTYEYIDTQKKTRETAEMNESIAIPVSQIDRFSVEPILETPYATVGDEAYLSVSFVNRGKATTSNIVVSIRCDNPAVTAANENFGNLEAGAADSVELYLTSTEAGEFTGDVVVEYEDENMNVKELTTPFTLTVDEPWFPSPDDMMGDEDPFLEERPETGPSPLSIVLCTIGGLAIAGPIALYLMKRVKAKGIEAFDEDF